MRRNAAFRRRNLGERGPSRALASALVVQVDREPGHVAARVCGDQTRRQLPLRVFTLTVELESEFLFGREHVLVPARRGPGRCLKLGRFDARDKGQMELYLRWLDRHERQPDENPPLGLILCADKNEEQIELLELSEGSVRVASYLTELPPRELLERKVA